MKRISFGKRCIHCQLGQMNRQSEHHLRFFVCKYVQKSHVPLRRNVEGEFLFSKGRHANIVDITGSRQKGLHVCRERDQASSPPIASYCRNTHDPNSASTGAQTYSCYTELETGLLRLHPQIFPSLVGRTVLGQASEWNRFWRDF